MLTQSESFQSGKCFIFLHRKTWEVLFRILLCIPTKSEHWHTSWVQRTKRNQRERLVPGTVLQKIATNSEAVASRRLCALENRSALWARCPAAKYSGIWWKLSEIRFPDLTASKLFKWEKVDGSAPLLFFVCSNNCRKLSFSVGTLKPNQRLIFVKSNGCYGFTDWAPLKIYKI